MRIIGICLALGHIYQNKGKGERKRPVDGAVARFEAVTDYADELYKANKKVKPFLICTAGYTWENPRRPEHEGDLSLAEQLDRYVVDHAGKWKQFLHTEPLCWGTRNEIREAIALAERQGFARPGDEVILLIASNWAHIPRVSIYANLYLPKGWKLKLLVAHHRFSVLDYLKEVVKLTRDALRYGPDLWRRRLA